MRIVIVHNFYQQPGGEDEVVRAEIALLRNAGHEVLTYFRHNDEIPAQRFSRFALPITTVWSRHSHKVISGLLREHRPSVVHFHNTFPLISPSAYYAARSLDVPVIQTLHNYRLLCPGANLLRDGRPCEDCVGKAVPLPALKHGCYRESRAASAAVIGMLATHRGIGTYAQVVDRFIALSEFSKSKFVEGGLPGDRIAVKPNCVYPEPEFHDTGTDSRDFALFIGRFSEEKGIGTFVDALKLLKSEIPVRIVGDGPMAESVKKAVVQLPNVVVEGWAKRKKVVELLRAARVVVFPSQCYENFPLTMAEAFSVATPVLCSRLGVHQELVEDGVNGILFTAGDPCDLASKLNSWWERTESLRGIGRTGRLRYQKELTPECNLQQLLEIYRAAMDQHRHVAEVSA